MTFTLSVLRHQAASKHIPTPADVQQEKPWSDTQTWHLSVPAVKSLEHRDSGRRAQTGIINPVLVFPSDTARSLVRSQLLSWQQQQAEGHWPHYCHSGFSTRGRDCVHKGQFHCAKLSQWLLLYCWSVYAPHCCSPFTWKQDRKDSACSVSDII